MADFKAFRNDTTPNWCPGCGHFAVQAAIQRAAANVGIQPEKLAIISGIGCSGRISGYINAYGLHGVHGRALPVAQGVKLANPELCVIAAGGDGDGYAIGMGHTIHAIRRNIDITYIVMDNQVYGLTKGQASPRSAPGFMSKGSPAGAVEKQISPLQLALSAGAGFVAQGFSADVKGLVSILEQGLRHKGFSFINVYSPCVTYNKVNTYDFFKQTLQSLDDDPAYDPTDYKAAMNKVFDTEGQLTGIVYKTEEPSFTDRIPGYADRLPIVHQDLQLPAAAMEEMIEQFC